MKEIDTFDCISPIDYRYQDAEVAKYLSENGFTRYKLRVEWALVTALANRRICSLEILREVDAAVHDVSTAEVYEEEKRIGHDIRALANCIRAKVDDDVKPFVHMTATSFDIVDTANAARYRDVVLQVLVPALIELEKVLINLAIREADTVQIGRTHGQHAVPITFGFAIAQYVSRIGGSIEELSMRATKLVGKFSGAVGAYNASSLFFDNPQRFEREVLEELGLKPAEISTQIVPPEALMRLMSEVTIAAGIMANLADDMRHLQRTEIGEVGEAFGADQVGSSTMPQKRNPINFENVKSMWKIVVGRITTVFMDQISEHQRDLTNSASARTYGETIAYTVSMTKRLTKTMTKLQVDHENMQKNLEMTKGSILAEPLQLILSALGHPDAHEKVRQLTLLAQKEKCSLNEAFYVFDGEEAREQYTVRMTAKQKEILLEPTLYIGIAPAKARKVAENWKQKLGL